jgi:hypothetical protein
MVGKNLLDFPGIQSSNTKMVVFFDLDKKGTGATITLMILNNLIKKHKR